MPSLLPALAALAVAAASPPTSGAPPAGLQAQLRARDQALLDAIAIGDKALWDGALTPTAVYVDENGRVIERKTFLDELQPLPTGASGRIAISDYRLTLSGDAALVIHLDDEDELFHGVPLKAQYLMTETWLKQGPDWKLAMVHAYVLAKDPPPVVLPEGKLKEYIGRYEAGDGLTFTLTREGDHLVGQSGGGEPHPVLAEAPDVLFTPGQPRTKLIVQRDKAGHVSGIIDRREGEDLTWRKAAG